MENKYYTPQIEDLRVGYQLEWLQEHGWHPTFLVYPESLVKVSMEPNKFRTKYLDKEDIESLGWVHYYTWGANNEILQFKKYACKMHLNLSNSTIGISAESDDGGYAGNCPSINELKFLMKLLNIK